VSGDIMMFRWDVAKERTIGVKGLSFIDYLPVAD